MRISLVVGATLAVVLTLARADAFGQTQETGFLDRDVAVDGIEYRYQVYVPRQYTRETRWPVILALHGGGEYGTDGIRQTAVGLVNAIRRRPDRFPAIAIFPQSRPDGTPGWHLAGGRAALAALDRTLAEFSTDPVVAVDESRRMAAALKAAGANVQYTELPGVDHNAWDPAYDNAGIIEWLLKQRRN